MNIEELHWIDYIAQRVGQRTGGKCDLEISATRLVRDDLMPDARIIAVTFTRGTHAQRYYLTVHADGTIEQWLEAPVQSNVISKQETHVEDIVREICNMV